MISELYPDQQEAIQAIRESLGQGVKRLMLQAPTGAGKTKIAAKIMSGVVAKKRRAAFVVPAIDLVDQTAQSFWAEGITDIGVIQGDHGLTDWSKPVQICSIQTIERRGVFPEADIVLHDEAHRVHKAQKRWLQHPDWQSVPMIGLSATPWTKGLGQLYQSLLVSTTTAELIKLGRLSPFVVYAASRPDLSEVKVVKNSDGENDYQQEQLSKAMQKGTLTADIVQTWKGRWGKGKTLCFGVDRAHAKLIQERFEYAGVRCGYQDAQTTMEERRRLKAAFHRGDLDVVSNVATLTTGIDWDVRCLILARPTKSEMLYCLDSETEILTASGWKGMGQIKVGEAIAACDGVNTKRGLWANVAAVVQRDMETAERWVEYAAPRANFRVTDGHRMIFSVGAEDGFRIETAATMPRASGVRVPTAVHMNQIGVPLSFDELYFIGMMMSDGTWGATAGAISQSERHPEIIKRIEASLQGSGIGYSKRRVEQRGVITERHPRCVFSFSAGKPRAHASLGKNMCGNEFKGNLEAVVGATGFRHLLPYLDKDFAPALFQMSKDQLLQLIRGLWDGDGSKKLGVDYTPRSLEICSARKLMMDRLQALCAINGMTANLRTDHGPSRTRPLYLITITDKDWRSCGGYSSVGRGQRPQIEIKPATNEQVWCVETDAGTIVTRRRGKVTVMGNCQIIGRALRTADEKDQAVILDHSQTTAELGFVTDIHHEHLDDGKPSKGGQRPQKKPKECPKCTKLKPIGSLTCDNCGYEWDVRSTIVEQEGYLQQVRDHEELKKRKGKNGEMTPAEREMFYLELKAYAVERGYKPGWAAMKYKSKFKSWPPREYDYRDPAPEVSPKTRSWIKSDQIRWAKSKHREVAHAG